ncbi:hypothetical protein [Burkholderia gladioli]|uniref:hypothetical protein n=1 Tax=Burkholderia gladioli TaxID=28095 RepID=UPI001641F987|nr:hypothetical protein [Burkholderia gladioli]
MFERQHKKQHNAWTNHEIALLREHWPTHMPMESLLALLPRHTENSITGYANKVLGLRRPTRANAVGHPQKQPAWERVRKLLSTPHTQGEVADSMGFTRTRASELIRLHRSEVYIAGWRWPEGKGKPEAEWALGNKPDAPQPMGIQRARRHQVRRIDPFATAAGLVAPPVGCAGRIYAQPMDIGDGELAA